MKDFLEFFGFVALWGTMSVVVTLILATLFAVWWKWVLTRILKVL